MIRLGTVGTSAICENFLDGIELTNRFELSAVYSRNFETGKVFGLKRNCHKVFTDIEEMAKSGEIDAVYIASPNSCHKEQCETFLKNGIHTICEKPIVTDKNDYLHLKNFADNNNVIFMEAIIPIFTDGYDNVKSAIEEIGKIQMARIDFCQRSSRLDRFLRGEHINIFDMSLCAGTLMDIGVYCVYAAVDFFGMPKSVKASCSYLYNGADGNGSAIFEYDDFLVNLTYSKTCDGALGSEIIGEKGVVKIKKISQYAGVELCKNGVTEKIVGLPTKAELMSGEANHFANFIEHFETYKEEYAHISELCIKVHTLMDIIKKNAGIKYPDNK